MTFIRKLALALSLAGCFSFSNAQTVDSTGNLITNGVSAGSAEGVWTGIGGYSQLNGAQPTSLWGCCTSYSGAAPFLDTSTGGSNGDSGQIHWSYGQATVGQYVNVPNVLAGQGAGLQIRGYSWNYDLRNLNGGGGQNGTDTMTVYSYLRDSTGAVLLDNTTTHNTQMDWTRFSGTRTLAAPASLNSVGNAGIQFTSADSGFWAGYYGPQIRNVSLNIQYSVDPCALNPLYASHCPGFNDVVLSGNLVPNPGAIATWGQSLNNTFAISTAIQHGGLGVNVHGFEWGYNTWSGNPYCAQAEPLFGICIDNRDPLTRTWVNIRDSSGNSLYSVTRDYNDHNYWKSNSYSYTLPQSRNSLTLGNFEFSGQTWDYAGINSMYARIKYTPDQCVLNPLYSSSCTGYQQAFYDQQCSANPLYDSGCPGYAQAYYNQQCSIDALYDSGCPGYETAYFNFQCTQNPLYNNSCPGYAQAYFDQQCGLNALYNTQCPGYAEAKTLQDLQQQLAAQNEPTVESSTIITTGVPTSSTTAGSATVALADPTRTETVVTTDVGGVELTTSGEISIPTGQPTATKEAIKESAKEETKKEEAKKETEKKRVDPRALAIARAAAREAETTALSTADQAVAFSQSDIATSSALGLGTGITISGFRPLGVGDSTEEEGKTAQGASSNKESNINLQNNTAQQGQQQDVATKSGPAVRNGGRVEGMEGGPDPAQLARVPMDFNQYLNAQLKDAQFYQSKEIYGGQRNVDNQRLLRGLTGGSDRLHQQMIDQQYNITGQ